MIHHSVLLHESIDGLAIRQDDIVLDATVNGGGHSAAMAERCGQSILIVGLDRDGNALEAARKRLTAHGARFELVQSDFRHLGKVLDQLGFISINRALFDLGLSSNQLEESGRGFSFQKDEPLLMTFTDSPNEADVTARDVVNTWSEETLAQILSGFGEERYARRIAQAIVKVRGIKPIETTKDLVLIIESAVPKKYLHGRTHFATRTFQAIRIAVNDELEALTEGLSQAFDRLGVNGRMAVISFHSLEDRIVKRFFKDRAMKSLGNIITKKPLVPAEEERTRNPRARSAKLRIIEKIS